MTEVNHKIPDQRAARTAATAAEAAEEMRQFAWTVEREVTTRAGGAATGVAFVEGVGDVRLTWYPRLGKEADHPLFAAVVMDDPDDRVVWVQGRCPKPSEVPDLVAEHGSPIQGGVAIQAGPVVLS